jgi:hypothetical protein
MAKAAAPDNRRSGGFGLGRVGRLGVVHGLGVHRGDLLEGLGAQGGGPFLNEISTILPIARAIALSPNGYTPFQICGPCHTGCERRH